MTPFRIYRTELNRLLAKGQNGGGWSVKFEIGEQDNAFAYIDMSAEGRYVTFGFVVAANEGRSAADIKQTAKHEYGHFVIGRLHWLATCRYIDPTEPKEEAENIARIFERLL